MNQIDRLGIESHVLELERVVERLLEIYECLALAADHRLQAVRRADPESIGALIEQERTIILEAEHSEASRARIVRVVAEKLGEQQPDRMTLRSIAKRVGGEAGESLGQKAELLRERLEGLHQRNEIVRRALVSLSAHMAGLWRQATSMLNHARTYGRAGSVDPGPRVVSCLDLTS